MGGRIARARERAGLNKNQLARAVGTSWQHVDHWERDRTAPSTLSLQRLAQVLGVSAAQLLGDDREAAASNEALETFVRSYAPPDLSDAELAWLRAAPIDPAHATPGQFLDLLHRLRTPAPASTSVRAPSQLPPTKTGKRAKVRIEDALSTAGRGKERRGA